MLSIRNHIQWRIVSACLKHMDFIISILVSLFENAVLMYRGDWLIEFLSDLLIDKLID